MAEMQTKSCLFNIFHAFIILVILHTVDVKNHTAGPTDNPKLERQSGCETLYLYDTVESLYTSEFNSSCLRIVAPSGMGIHMDFRDVNSTWSIYDYFYIQLDQNCEDSGIIALKGKPKPCSTLFNTSALEIHFHSSLLVDFSSSSIDTNFQQPICNIAATVAPSHHDFQPCTKLENFNRVHYFTHEIIPYNELRRLHPSLDFTTFPDEWFQPSELPLLNLTTTGRFLGCELEQEELDVNLKKAAFLPHFPVLFCPESEIFITAYQYSLTNIPLTKSTKQSNSLWMIHIAT